MWTNNRTWAALAIASVFLVSGCVSSEGGSSNEPPVASVSNASLTAASGDTVQLVGSATDADGDSLTYSWTQTSGPDVTLSGADTRTPSFTAPDTDTSVTLVFQFQASDGKDTSNAVSVTVTVDPAVPNEAPVASVENATLTVAGGTQVELVGSATDADGDTLTYSWTQTSGEAVTLTGADMTTASFTAPDVSAETQLVFSFVANDGREDSNTVTVTVTVVANEPPVASVEDTELFATVGETVSLVGTATDADGDTLSYSWTQVATGTTVTLTDADMATASFVAPEVADGETLQFEFFASDGISQSNVVTVSVTVANLPAAAGPTNMYVAQNGETSQNQIQKFSEGTAGSQNYVGSGLFTSIDNEGIALDILGNAYHFGDDSDNFTSGYSTVCAIGNRAATPAYSGGDRDREVRGEDDGDGNIETGENDPGLSAAKGAVLVHGAGYLIVADFGGTQVQVFGAGIAGNVGPIATINLGSGAKPWDVAYDDARDILYVASTAGSLHIYDGFIAGIESEPGAVAETRPFVRIVDANGVQLGVNLHGIVYEPVSDSLIISDVGATTEEADAGFASDGRLYVLRGASTISGNTQAAAMIAGAATLLGNPVDIALNGRDLWVAEKAGNKMLQFKNILSSDGGNIAPDTTIDIDAPESLAIEVLDQVDRPVGGDLVSGQTATVTDLVLQVDTGDSTQLLTLDPALGAQDTVGVFNVGDALEDAVAFSMVSSGDAYVVSHLAANEMTLPPVPAATRVNVINRLTYRIGTSEMPGGLSGARDRAFAYEGEVDPSGFPALTTAPDVTEVVDSDVDPASNLLFLLDVGDGSTGRVHVLSQCGTGGLLASVAVDDGDTDAGARLPTGLDYDPENRDLYVSMDNGQVAIFRQFGNIFASEPQPFFVTPQVVNDGTPAQAAPGYSAIEFVPGANALLMTSVGDSTGAAVDGSLVRVGNARNITLTPIASVISGAATLLQDPVDLVFDGSGVFVLDQGQPAVMYFDTPLSTAGQIAPAGEGTSLADIGGTPVSLSVIMDYFAGSPDDRVAASN